MVDGSESAGTVENTNCAITLNLICAKSATNIESQILIKCSICENATNVLGIKNPSEVLFKTVIFHHNVNIIHNGLI